MGFSAQVKEKIFVDTARHCCVCHRYAGTNIEVHHIVPQAAGGPDTYDNAIALCFDCHANAGHYNPKHPKGAKYSPSELRKAKSTWIEMVKNHAINEPNEAELIDVDEDGLITFLDITKPEIFDGYFNVEKMINIDYFNPDYNYLKKQIIIEGGSNVNPIWGEYISLFPQVIQPYIMEIRKEIVKTELIHKTGQDMNGTLFEFSDGVTFGFTWRAWGDMVQAIGYARGGYAEHYM